MLNAVQTARLRRDATAGVFCSRECAGSTPAHASCFACRTTFHPNQVQRARLRHGGVAFCSRECFVKSRVTFKCDACGAIYVANAYRRKKMAKGAASLCHVCRISPATDKSHVAGAHAWMEANT